MYSYRKEKVSNVKRQIRKGFDIITLDYLICVWSTCLSIHGTIRNYRDVTLAHGPTHPWKYKSYSSRTLIRQLLLVASVPALDFLCFGCL